MFAMSNGDECYGEKKNVMERVCWPGGEGYHEGLTFKQTSEGGEGVDHGNNLGEEHPRKKEEETRRS